MCYAVCSLCCHSFTECISITVECVDYRGVRSLATVCTSLIEFRLLLEEIWHDYVVPMRPWQPYPLLPPIQLYLLRYTSYIRTLHMYVCMYVHTYIYKLLFICFIQCALLYITYALLLMYIVACAACDCSFGALLISFLQNAPDWAPLDHETTHPSKRTHST